MSKEELKKIIIEIVENYQGMKATELALRFVASVHEKNMLAHVESILIGPYDFVELLDEMDTNGDLVFVDYVLSQMDYRLKQFVLPKGTKVTVKE